jgi:hypothetical protein
VTLSWEYFWEEYRIYMLHLFASQTWKWVDWRIWIRFQNHRFQLGTFHWRTPLPHQYLILDIFWNQKKFNVIDDQKRQNFMCVKRLFAGKGKIFRGRGQNILFFKKNIRHCSQEILTANYFWPAANTKLIERTYIKS